MRPDYFRKLDLDPVTAPLVRALEKRPELWEQDRYWKHHPQPTFAQVDSIIARFPDRAPYGFKNENARIEYNAKHDWKECYNQPVALVLPEAHALAMQLMSAIGGERLGRILINKLPPKSLIPWHSDIAKELKYYDRYHIVLKSNPDTFLQIGTEKCVMPVRSVWWFENAFEHTAYNGGDTDRWHMIVDIRSKDTP